MSREHIHIPWYEWPARWTWPKKILLVKDSKSMNPHTQNKLKHLSSSHSPVPHFDSLSRGGEDGYVIWAEGQSSDVCTMTAQCEARGFSASRILLWSLQCICLHCVILQKKSNLHLSVRNQKAVHWSVDKKKILPSMLDNGNMHEGTALACILSDLILDDAFMFASFWISSFNFLSTTGSGTSSPPPWDLHNITVHQNIRKA